jgi:prepilin-type processing-associated H-X9-DG protein
MTNTRITVKTIQGDILTFKNVSNLTMGDGHVSFIDAKTGIKKSFPVENCEIEEMPRE